MLRVGCFCEIMVCRLALLAGWCAAMSLAGSCGHQTPKLQIHLHEQQDYHGRSRCVPNWKML